MDADYRRAPLSLVTRCPNCDTAFRVLPAQLAARGGRVRCGKCATVFDGVGSLLSAETLAALPEEPSPRTGLFNVRASATQADALAAGEIAAPATKPPIAAAESWPPRLPEAAGQAKAAPVSAPMPARKTEPSQVEPPLPEFLLDKRPRTSYVATWSLLALLGLAALAAQAALHFRTEIAVLLPKTRAPLEIICAMLDCELRLPRRAELMSIESSDLQADAQRSGVIVLNALLRNRAPFVQEYPALELTLTDERDEPVVRRVLSASDYLQERRAAASQGIAGGAEEAVRIYLDTSRIRATGYRLYLFYP